MQLQPREREGGREGEREKEKEREREQQEADIKAAGGKQKAAKTESPLMHAQTNRTTKGG